MITVISVDPKNIDALKATCLIMAVDIKKTVSESPGSIAVELEHVYPHNLFYIGKMYEHYCIYPGQAAAVLMNHAIIGDL